MIWCSNNPSKPRRGSFYTAVEKLVWGILFLVPVAGGHAPVPDSVLDPKTPAEAWNVVRLSTENVARLLKENRLVEVPEQISLCSPALRALPKWAGGSPEAKRRAVVEAMHSSVAIDSLAQASAVGDKTTSEMMLVSVHNHLTLLASAYDPLTVKADIFYCPMHPDFVSADPSAYCAKCGMSLLRRRIPYSFVYVPAGEPTIVLTAKSDGEPTAGRPVRVTVHMARRSGSPILLSDLLVMHTQPIHFLVVDPSLEDYHHEHPVPTETPGDYAFSFTPAKNESYRIFADLLPADNGIQEFPYTDLSGTVSAPAAPVHGANAFDSTVGNLHFQLSIAEASGAEVRVGSVCILRVAVSDHATDKPSTNLEPVMGAFAHLVGFYDDYRTLVHLHPLGSEIVNLNARGGPILEFKFYPPRPGFVRLYCQVQAEGKAVFAPFDIHVTP